MLTARGNNGFPWPFRWTNKSNQIKDIVNQSVWAWCGRQGAVDSDDHTEASDRMRSKKLYVYTWANSRLLTDTVTGLSTFETSLQYVILVLLMLNRYPTDWTCGHSFVGPTDDHIHPENWPWINVCCNREHIDNNNSQTHPGLVQVTSFYLQNITLYALFLWIPLRHYRRINTVDWKWPT